MLAIAGAPVLTGMMNTVIHFSIQRPWLRPRLHRVARDTAVYILGLGFLFLVLQVAGAIGYQTDNLILAQVLGPDSVTTYAVTNRLFMIVPAILFLIMIPLWPVYGEAAARGDVQWIKKTLNRSLLIALGLTIPANLLLVIFSRPLLRVWVGPQIVPSLLLLTGLATWTIVANGVCVPLAMFCNGVGFIRVQAICSAFMAVSNVLLSIYLTRRIGISGVVFGSILSQVIFVMIPYFAYVPRILAQLHVRRPSGSPMGMTLSV
jgi:O-antigen/teichoic acid export membrane protein